MNKKYKLHFKSLGKLFLLIGVVFAIIEIENANAQIIQIQIQKSEFTKCMFHCEETPTASVTANNQINGEGSAWGNGLGPYSTSNMPSYSYCSWDMTDSDWGYHCYNVSCSWKNGITYAIPILKSFLGYSDQGRNNGLAINAGISYCKTNNQVCKNKCNEITETISVNVNDILKAFTKEEFAKKVIESADAITLQKIYDPNKIYQ